MKLMVTALILEIVQLKDKFEGMRMTIRQVFHEESEKICRANGQLSRQDWKRSWLILQAKYIKLFTAKCNSEVQQITSGSESDGLW